MVWRGLVRKKRGQWLGEIYCEQKDNTGRYVYVDETMTTTTHAETMVYVNDGVTARRAIHNDTVPIRQA